ncbi:hypothetical protein Y1Q_0020169 [Alligator mississippiensis]|uniref:Uncharacterized protein n=1 Tax=Alligator mississippiensis TaxID=8496 RepID=A0A151NCQ8_ALLMI|nr:hypothetical protein Y1Q_0020169 [Alligator mississippiensis]
MLFLPMELTPRREQKTMSPHREVTRANYKTEWKGGTTDHLQAVFSRHPHKDHNCDMMLRGLSAILDIKSDVVCGHGLLLGSHTETYDRQSLTMLNKVQSGQLPTSVLELY